MNIRIPERMIDTQARQMLDMKGIVFVRGKTPDESILKLAKARDIVVMRSPKRMYDACGLLYLNGLRGD